jgi:23S rRNA (uracil1939-C5)-methyltransferase
MQQGTIECLAFGGKGIARMQDRFVVFIPFTIPGEKVRFEVTRRKKNYAEGRIIEILEKDPGRLIPLCPYFGTCGGCQLQHMSYPLQAHYKQQTVQESLQTLFPQVKVDLTCADPIWAYRSHITLTLEPSKSGFSIGYVGLDNITLVKIDQCPIFHTAVNPIIPTCQSLASELSTMHKAGGKLKIINRGEGEYILAFHFLRIPLNFSYVAPQYLGKGICAISATSPQEQLAYGDFHLEFALENFTLKYHPNAFLQNHLNQSRNMAFAVRDWIKDSSPKILLDLYSGIGVTSLLSAPYAQSIFAVESNSQAVQIAEANARAYQIQNVTFLTETVEKAAPDLLRKNPDMAVVNPPRIGLSKTAAEMLATSSLKKIIYVSCHPASLKRDLTLFKREGFHLTHARAFDMFPQTGHVETLVVLAR